MKTGRARVGAAASNFEDTLAGQDSELAAQIAKDPYVFDFLGLGFYIAVVDDRLRDPSKHAPTVGILLCADRNDTVVRYALSGAAQPMAVAGYTYDALPPNEQAALPSGTEVASALGAPVEVDGRQMTLAEHLENMAGGPSSSPDHEDELT